MRFYRNLAILVLLAAAALVWLVFSAVPSRATAIDAPGTIAPPAISPVKCLSYNDSLNKLTRSLAEDQLLWMLSLDFPSTDGVRVIVDTYPVKMRITMTFRRDCLVNISVT